MLAVVALRKCPDVSIAISRSRRFEGEDSQSIHDDRLIMCFCLVLASVVVNHFALDVLACAEIPSTQEGSYRWIAGNICFVLEKADCLTVIVMLLIVRLEGFD